MEQKEKKKTGFLAGLVNKLDKSLKEKAQSKPVCNCNSDKEDKKDSCCSG